MPYSNSLTYSHTPHLEMLSHLKIASLGYDSIGMHIFTLDHSQVIKFYQPMTNFQFIYLSCRIHQYIIQEHAHLSVAEWIRQCKANIVYQSRSRRKRNIVTGSHCLPRHSWQLGVNTATSDTKYPLCPQCTTRNLDVIISYTVIKIYART